MKRYSKVGVAAVLCLMLALSALLPATALTPSYKVQEPYLSSPYYSSLVAYELTGDMRQDVLSIAFTQIGYHEGDSEADMDGLNVMGNKNFVEYNRLYGKLDNGEGNGVSYGYAWCAAFVSWCLRQAGVPASLAKTEVSCIRMTNWFKENSTYHDLSSGYTPLPGDLIMFHRGDFKPHHVGLVVGVKEGYVYTIEGNSGGVVGPHMYKEKDSGIMGYCVPAYTVKEGAEYNFTMDAEASKPGQYIITADPLVVRAGAGTSHRQIGALKLGETVEVTWCDGSWGRIDYKGQEGWISMTYAVPMAHLFYSVRYEVGEGKGGPTVQRKQPGESVTIAAEEPTQKGYTFGGWATEQPAKTVAYKAGDIYTADENLILYAIWNPEIYTLTLKMEDGSVWKTVEVAFGERVNIRDLIPEKESDSENHYTFAGWNESIPTFLRGDTERTATFTATPLTAEEKAALQTTAVTQEETGDDALPAPAISASPVMITVIALAILAVGGVVTAAAIVLRRRKLAAVMESVQEAQAASAEEGSEAESSAEEGAVKEEAQAEETK